MPWQQKRRPQNAADVLSLWWSGATSQPVPVRRPFSTRDTPQTAAQHATAEADDEITDAELSAMSVPAGVGGLSPMVLIIGGVVILGGAYFLLSRKSASKSKAA